MDTPVRTRQKRASRLEKNRAATKGRSAPTGVEPCSAHDYWERDSFSSTAFFDLTDRALRASLSRFTLGLSPRALTSAYLDWATGLSYASGKRAQLMDKAFRKSLKFSDFALSRSMHRTDPAGCIEPLPQDRRFRDDTWKQFPFDLIYQSFLLSQQWWHNATTGVKGVSGQHERVVEFAARQWLDVFSPSNFLLTNPKVLKQTAEQGGQNLIRGFQNYVEDLERTLSGQRPEGAENFAVGHDVAATPGKVVFRNRLIELIQYEPATKSVKAEPLLIVPAWIMKYYILDLSQQNSLVKFLVDRGHTVFMISWKNPDPGDRDLSMDDYQQLGIMSALEAVNRIVPDRHVHGVGYCLGGTLLAIAAAAMARDDDDRFKSLTFLATQIDFEEAGELTLFINEEQIAFLEDMMWEQGFLDTHQMAGTFQLLRSNDLIWSKIVQEYLLGERNQMNDLMAWNTDATRMPYKMHSEYLRHLFLNNDLAEGRYIVDRRPVTVSDIRAPLFVVGTERDHVAPWRSVYKFHLLTDADITFLLTSGGHNAGIVSEPGHRGRTFRVSAAKAGDPYIGPRRWENETPVQEGSWWPEWQQWLADQSSGESAPPEMGVHDSDLPTLQDAPGSYVLQQ
ncbi:MAG: alpha/beta fold hydrolase [Stappiaceae bacterium]